MNTPHHIIELRAENVKRLRAITIKPDGSLIVIGGNNAQGKSSVLHAIAYALGGKDAVDAQPLRTGEEDGRVVLKLDNGTTVRRRFFPDGRTDLEIKDENGRVQQSPQALLDAITGKITFDPLSFRALPRAAKLDAVQQLVGLDFAEEDLAYDRLFAERRDLKRDAERARFEAEAMPYVNVGPRMDTTGHEAALATATALAADHTTAKDHADRVRVSLAKSRDLMATLQANRAALVKQLEELDARIAKGAAALPAIEKTLADAETALTSIAAQQVDVSATAAALEAARAHNRRVDANLARDAAMKKAQDLFDRTEEMTRALEHLVKAKEKRIREAKFPVQGMGFTRDGLTLHGLPFEQASDAEQLRASVLIAAALNPTLRVMLVHNGEKLDAAGLRLLAELAAAHDLQVWLERVSTGGECSVIIEDGHLAATP